MTCADLEILLCDYLDGALAAAEKAAVERHLSACAVCAELVRDSAAALAFLERVPDVEPPPELVTRMFAIPGLQGARPGLRAGVRGWLHNLAQPLLQPRLVMGLSLTILFFGMMARCAGVPERRLSPADLNPVKVWAGLEDRAQRAWERSVKFYENIRVVYQLQSKLREWKEQQEQENSAAPERTADERRLPVPSAPAQKDPGTPGEGNKPRK